MKRILVTVGLSVGLLVGLSACQGSFGPYPDCGFYGPAIYGYCPVF